MFPGRRKFVKILFDNDLLTSIVDRFGEKEIMRYDDHHFILKTHIMASNQFFARISAFRKKAKILSPSNVYDEYKALRLYPIMYIDGAKEKLSVVFNPKMHEMYIQMSNSENN